jgi:hypothetical protein
MSYEPRCTICGDAVDLIESKTDEYGQAVHENCYVWSVELRKPRRSEPGMVQDLTRLSC